MLHSRSPRSLVFAISILLLLICLLANIFIGTANINLGTVWNALFAFDGSTDHLIIRAIRLPRALTAAVVGAALAVAGALMQGLTRNPLADPGILGINAGAALAVVATTYFLGEVPIQVSTWVAFAGATIAAGIVYILGSVGRSGINSLKLVLAGAVLTYLFSALTTGILILNQQTLDQIRFWIAGSVAGRKFDLLLQVFPYTLVGLIVSFSLGSQMTTLTLGEEVARGLGLRVGWIKGIAAIAVVLLAGSAVALAGPIAFIGLAVPHLVRFWVGIDYQWLLPSAAIAGAMLLSVADLGSRLLIQPQELPVGVMMTLLGAPFLIYLARLKVK